jgi:hypothetical protein
MSAWTAQHESRAMNQRLTRGSRLLASVIAMALAFVSSATCLAAVMQMPEKSQHACCKGMKQDCGSGDSMTVQKDCCVVQSADVAGLTTTAQAITASASAISTLVVFEPLPAQASPGAALDPDIPRPSSSPTYLLVSVFRL